MGTKQTGGDPYSLDDLGELISEELEEIDARKKQKDASGQPKPANRPRSAPVIQPLRLGYTGSRYKPQRLSKGDIERWGRKDAWTISATAFLLCGYRPTDVPLSKGDIPPEVMEAAKDMGLACMRGRLHPIGPENVLGRRNYLCPEEVIKWAADRFTRFPFANSARLTADTKAVIATRGEETPQRRNARQPRRVQERRAVEKLLRENPDSLERTSKEIACELRSRSIQVKDDGFPDLVRRAKRRIAQSGKRR